MHLRCFRGALQPHETRLCLPYRRRRLFSATHSVQQQHVVIQSVNAEERVPQAAIDKPPTSERNLNDRARSKAPSHTQTHESPEHGLRPALNQRFSPFSTKVNDEAERLQRSLHEKFAAQRLKNARSTQDLGSSSVSRPDPKSSLKELRKNEKKLREKKALKSADNDISQGTTALPANLFNNTLKYYKGSSEVKSKAINTVRTVNLVKKLNKDLGDIKKTIKKANEENRRQLKLKRQSLKLEKKQQPRSPDALRNTEPESTALTSKKVKSKRLARRKSGDKLPESKVRKIANSPQGWTTRLEDVPGNVVFENAVRRQPTKSQIKYISAQHLNFLALEVERPPVPSLSYGLERALFNPGVYHLQDPRSRVYNFDPYLQNIVPVTDFDFDALKQYVTSSRDESLEKLAREQGKRYVGSSSSMTSVLSHFHFLLSQWRSINTGMLSRDFPDKHVTSFTELQRSPSAAILRWKNGSYAIDADKEFDSATVLMFLGRSLEKLFTMDTEKFERYRRSNSNNVPPEEKETPESYHYSTLGDFLMRSQLDAHDPRLPGTGMFDLKTRAVVSVRMDASNYEKGAGYQIKSRHGAWESYEREYFDMIRAAFLKYSLQVRMGRMDGIFVAFHNTDRIFGFQYISLPEMDSTLHGQWDTTIGDQEFKLSLSLLNQILDKATARYPNTSLRLHFEAREAQTPFMYIFAEPVTEDQIKNIQTHNDARLQKLKQEILGLDRPDPQGNENEGRGWAELQANVQDAMDKDIRDPINESSNSIQHDESSQEHEVPGTSPLSVRVSAEKSPENPTFQVVEGENNEVIERTKARVDDDLEENFRSDNNEAASADKNIGGNSNGETYTEGKPSVELVSGKSQDYTLPFEGSNGADKENVNGEAASLSEYTQSTQPEVEGADKLGSDAERLKMIDMSKPLAPSSADSRDGFTSQGDDTILENPSQEDTTKLRRPGPEVLAMTLTIRNKINGLYVLRPDELKSEDDWSVEYSLEEVLQPGRAWSLYQACQMRRRKKHEELDSREQDGEELSYYVRKLRQMSREGAEWRKQMDKKDRQVPVRVLGRS
ncbi:MAG: hypothetical protein Q9167_004973 [Letrouitia subvulpina]